MGDAWRVDLQRLERTAALLADQGHDTSTTQFMIFSAAGFHPEFVAMARRRTDVRLVNLPTLLDGTRLGS